MYLSLQRIYKDHAKKDILEIEKYTKEKLKQLGKSEEFISLSEIEKFCKNSRNLRIKR